jgi:hypothetical protein
MVFPFHLSVPPGLQFNHKPTNQGFEFKEPMAATLSSDHSAIYHHLHLRLGIANDLSLTIGVARIGWKEILMRLGYQFNSYNLMHIQES